MPRTSSRCLRRGAAGQRPGYGLIVACLGGVGLAALAALLFGWFSVRLSGTQHAMLTLAFAQIARSIIVFQWDAVTGGSNGMVGICRRTGCRSRAISTGSYCWCGSQRCLRFAGVYATRLRGARQPRRAGESRLPSACRHVVCNGHGSPLPAPSPGWQARYAFSKGSISPDVMSRSALGRCTGDGVARRYQHAARPDHRGGRVYLAAGRWPASTRVLARQGHDPAAGGVVSTRHCRKIDCGVAVAEGRSVTLDQH